MLKTEEYKKISIFFLSNNHIPQSNWRSTGFGSLFQFFLPILKKLGIMKQPMINSHRKILEDKRNINK